MSDLIQRIFELAKTPQLLNLAIITEEGKPWVPYVFGNADAELSFRFCPRFAKTSSGIFGTILMSTLVWVPEIS